MIVPLVDLLIPELPLPLPPARPGVPVDVALPVVDETGVLLVMTCAVVLLPLTVWIVVTTACVWPETGGSVVKEVVTPVGASEVAVDESCVVGAVEVVCSLTVAACEVVAGGDEDVGAAEVDWVVGVGVDEDVSRGADEVAIFEEVSRILVGDRDTEGVTPVPSAGA